MNLKLQQKKISRKKHKDEKDIKMIVGKRQKKQ